MKTVIQECPVLRPSAEQFQDFRKFVEATEKAYAKEFGMVKVIPPTGWIPRQSTYDCLDDMLLTGPIEQNLFGQAGIYQTLNIEKKSMPYREYRKKSIQHEPNFQGKEVKDIEDTFWKSVAFSPPLYGADIQTALMESCAGAWNLAKLNSLLSAAVKQSVSGVNVPYIYVGSWKALFCWHKEDMDLSAINFLHMGKSKFWYSIPSSQGQLLQRQATKLFPEQFNKCPQHLRHKTTLINPYTLKSRIPQINISKAEHKPGQFILVFGGAYHTGFNFGFNLAQAVNYATLRWLGMVQTAKYCHCRKDSVAINVETVFENLSKSEFANTKEFRQFRKDMLEEEEVESKGVHRKSIAKKQEKKKDSENHKKIKGQRPEPRRRLFAENIRSSSV